MKRNHIAALGLVAAVASTTALAQAGAPPDFSPMKPRTPGTSEAQSYDTQSNGIGSAPEYVAPEVPVQTENRLLDAYEASNPPAAPQEPVVIERYPSRVQPPPAQSTIGQGLFNRQGPNDFGA